MIFRFSQEDNLVTISNSILKHFTGENLNLTNKKLDEILAQKNYDKVVVMLFDGLGKSIRRKNLSENDFLIKKEKFDITSVFPPTTAAATTAFLTGLYPNQTGWIGWQQYFKQCDRVVEMFTNCDAKTKALIKGPKISEMYLPTTSIIDIINESNKAKAYYLGPSYIQKGGGKNLIDFFEKGDALMKKDDRHFIYMYWTDPDSKIHQYGTKNYVVRDVVKDINRFVLKYSKKNKDNLIIVLADHSLVDTTFFYTFEHEDFKECLTNITSLDSRSSFFHVKDGKFDDFKRLFDKYYGKYFVLKTKEEVLNEKWFGPGVNHPLLEDFIGDFMATSISEYGFTNDETCQMIGAHSGSLEEESLISVSIINE